MSARTILSACLFLNFGSAFLPSAAAQPLGTAFTYQGSLENAGSPANGNFNVVFQLFDAQTLGNQIGPTLTFDGSAGNPPPVAVTDGLFTAPIDFGSTAFSGNKRWLSITVSGTTLTPRQELTAAPNALFALNADRLDGLDSTAFLQSISVPLTLSGTSSTHIIRGQNASTASGALGVLGLSTAATGSTFGGFFESNSTAGRGVHGSAIAATGSTRGVSGQSNSTAGVGVFGVASATSGSTYGMHGVTNSNTANGGASGVLGETNATGGFAYGVTGRSNSSADGTGVLGYAAGASGVTRGVRGISESSTGIGVHGQATAATGPAYGGYFESTGIGGGGVYGFATSGRGVQGHASSGFGVYGQSADTAGIGVYGLASATTGTTYGGLFESNSASGRGVTGYATDNSNSITYGVFGQSNSTAGRGVYGFATFSGFLATVYGVYGEASITGGNYGVYANGDMGASGVKSFRIDHPDDPANKYLLHYSSESPSPQNFYSGNVITDENGYASVELPEYFEAINANFKYQLTVVDDANVDGFVQAKVSNKIRGNRFQIRTSAPNVEVSWRVEGDRNDAYVRLKNPKDVVEKQGLERGTYQHPELYGQPPERGMNYSATR